jgi:DNA-binding MarR family transcriptional regulator
MNLKAERQRKRQLAVAVKGALRELGNQLSLLNHRVGARVQLRDIDLDCLDLINMHGPLSPSVLARRAGVHPATVTGILDRLERGGWVARDRDQVDRRGVVIRIARGRNVELYRLYSGMSSAMDEICADYDPSQLELIVEFLGRVSRAGRDATDDLAGG